MAGSNSIRSDAMPSANANPAAQVNFIFRQLPDDVLDAIGAHRGGAYHQDTGASGVPHESVIAAVGGDAVAAGSDNPTVRLFHNRGEDNGRHFVIIGGGDLQISAPTPPAGRGEGAAHNHV